MKTDQITKFSGIIPTPEERALGIALAHAILQYAAEHIEEYREAKKKQLNIHFKQEGK